MTRRTVDVGSSLSSELPSSSSSPYSSFLRDFLLIYIELDQLTRELAFDDKVTFVGLSFLPVFFFALPVRLTALVRPNIVGDSFSASLLRCCMLYSAL